jgi:endonuclease III
MTIDGITMYKAAWSRTIAKLETDLPTWKVQIDGWGQLAAVEARKTGRRWSNDEAFQGFVMSVLSNNTKWDRVEKVRSELRELFCGYSLEGYAALDPTEVDKRLVPWFENRKAGSTTLRARLKDLISAAKKLVARSVPHGSVEDYVAYLFRKSGRDPKQLALTISTGPEKLNGFGPPLAAEALKNLGYDVAKPDRHMNRALGALGWVRFPKWGDGDQLRFAAPKPRLAELLEVMRVVEEWANAVGERVTLVDNAVWLICADSGLHLPNREIRDLLGGP